MKNQLYLLTAIILSFSDQIHAQTTKEQHANSNIQLSGLSDQQKLKELASIHHGTYQLRVSNENYSPLLTLDILHTIVNSRLPNSSVVIELDPFTDLYIPSTSIIQNSAFIPLEPIVYASEITPDTTSD